MQHNSWLCELRARVGTAIVKCQARRASLTRRSMHVALPDTPDRPPRSTLLRTFLSFPSSSYSFLAAPTMYRRCATASMRPALRFTPVPHRPILHVAAPSRLPSCAILVRRAQRSFWSKKPDAPVATKQIDAPASADTATKAPVDGTASKGTPVVASKAASSVDPAAAAAVPEKKETLREKVTEAAGDVAGDMMWWGPGPILTFKLWLLQKGVRKGASMLWVRMRGKKEAKPGLIRRLFRKK